MADPTVYADRYEIVREIARGGMANVYLARDTLLDRAVALKVLPAELSRDPAFVERFRLEAQAVASLNDPAIVAVYDWGQEQSTSFIVMEYVEGRTLRDAINQGTLDPDHAARIAADIAKALSAAHRAGVVHRDVKPGNVLITPDDQVKVADFGIARANGAGNGLTRTGAVMGTATYFSPEQAQGMPVDARSDVYSLGIVLYEMVTGGVPFAGDSAVSVAYLHVREPVVAPSQREPSVPPGLETIILTCLAKDPIDRYQSADELRADLLRFRRGQQLVGGPTTAAVAAVGAGGEHRDETVAMARTSVVPAAMGSAGDAVGRPPRSRGPVAIVIAFLVALIAVVAFLLVQVFQDTGSDTGKTIAVKGVEGLLFPDARQQLEAQGFEVKVRRESNSRPIGTVFKQDPEAGALKSTGTVVTLFVSGGQATVTVPKVDGLNQLIATANLIKREFIVTPVPTAHDTIPIGTVIRSDPAGGTKHERGTNVTIFVSAGPAPIDIPNVSGLDQVDATQRLVSAGFRVAKTTEPSTTVEAGRVIRTEPGGGEKAARDSTVTLVVSAGPRQETIPDVVGMTQSAAVNALSAAGFEVSVSQVTSSPGNVGKVISQNPGGGGKGDAGSTVTITVGVAPVTTTTTSSTTQPPPP